MLVDRRLQVLGPDDRLARARADDDEVLGRIQPVMDELRLDRISVGRERRRIDEQLRPGTVRAEERGQQQVQVHGQRVERRDLVRQRPDQPGRGLAQRFVERDPGRALVEVALDAERSPRVQFGLHGRPYGPGLCAERLAGEVDPRRAVRTHRQVESLALRRERVGRVLFECEGLVGSDGGVCRDHVAGTGGSAQERVGGPGEHPLPARLGEIGQGLDRRTRHGLAERERIVGPEGDPVLADDARDEPEGVRIVGQRVDVDPAHGLARLGVRGGRREVRAGVEPGLDAPEQARERPAAMGEQESQRRVPIEHATQHDRGDGQGEFRRHPHEPRQPVAGHPFGRQHVPGVDEHGGAKRVRSGQDGFDGRIVEVAITDVRPDLDTGQAELPDAPFQLVDREVRILERDGPEAGEPVRPRGDDLGEMIVQLPRDDGRIGRRLVVGEHDRDGREDLEPDPGPVAILQAHGRIPAVVADLAERATVDDDARPTRPERLQLRPAAVPEPRPVVRPGRRQDVGVDVDPIEGHEGLRASPAWAAA